MSSISVEYAHIYTNQHISEEHQTSVSTLSDVQKTAEAEGKTVSLVVMVDDYSFPDPSFNYTEFTDWLKGQGFEPNLLIRESQLVPVCDEVLSVLQDEKLKNQLIDYVKAKKYPCSLFIAAWYLLRLGKLSSPIFPGELVSDEVINIFATEF